MHHNTEARATNVVGDTKMSAGPVRWARGHGVRGLRRHAIALGLACAMAGCSTVRLSPPPGYRPERDAGGYDYRAVSPTGGAIGVKIRANKDRGAGLEFWAAEIERQKVVLEQMRLVSRDAIHTDAGKNGALFHLVVGGGSGQVTYLLAVFVDGGRVITVEAAEYGDPPREHLEALRASIRSVRF